MDKLREIYRYRKRHIVFSNDDDINEIADINMFTPEIAEENELIDELIKSINDLEVSAQQIIFEVPPIWWTPRMAGIIKSVGGVHHETLW